MVLMAVTIITTVKMVREIIKADNDSEKTDPIVFANIADKQMR